MKSSKNKLWITLSIIVVSLGVIFVSVLIPTTMSDGLEKFHGEEKEEAKQALEEYIEQSTTSIEKIGSIGVFKYRVERVEKNEDGAPGACEAEYKVFISERTFFGLHPEPRYALNC